MRSGGRYNAVLPDLVDEDICGSGFAITAYTVSDELGGEAALAQFEKDWHGAAYD